jgi:hypothetical protein
LRTVFINVDGTPKQKILNDAGAFQLTVVDLRGGSPGKVQQIFDEESAIPFDLTAGPLFRAKLIQLDSSSFVLIFTIHHIIADGWTMDILFNDMVSLYESHNTHGKNMLPPLRIQYKDFAAWEHSQLHGTRLEFHRKFWMKQFEGELPKLNLRTDYPRPAVRTYQGVSTSFGIANPVVDQLTEISRENGVTLFVTLLAAVKTILYRYTRQRDIIVGSPFAGRSHPDLENLVGVFINMLAFRTQVGEDETFATLLKKLKKTVFDVYEHQVYPFDDLVKDLRLSRDPSRSPLFDVVFSLQNIGLSDVTEEEANQFQQVDVLSNNNLFDLVIIASKYNKGLLVNINYNHNLFSKETIDAFKKRLAEVVTQIAGNPQIALDDLVVFEKQHNAQEHIIAKSFELEF